MAESKRTVQPGATRSSGRVERRRDRRKSEIIATATRLLSASGYHGMSLEEVAEESDIAKATLYHYFSSKDELVAAVFEALMVEVDALLRAALSAVGEVGNLQRLQALIREQIRILTDAAPEVAIIFAWPRSWPKTLEPLMKDSRRRHDALFRDVVETGIAANDFDCPDADVALQCLHGVLNQSSLWIRPNLSARKKAELRETVVVTASRLFSREA